MGRVLTAEPEMTENWREDCTAEKRDMRETCVERRFIMELRKLFAAVDRALLIMLISMCDNSECVYYR